MNEHRQISHLISICISRLICCGRTIAKMHHTVKTPSLSCPFLPPSPMHRSRKARQQCDTVRDRLLNFQSPSSPKMSVTFMPAPCCFRQVPCSLPVLPVSRSSLSPHTPPPPDALRLSLLVLSSCFLAPSPSFLQWYCAVPYRTGTQNLVPAYPCCCCCCFVCSYSQQLSMEGSTKHQA